MRYLKCDGTWDERDPAEKTPCGDCGMLAFDDEYHPFTACLLFRKTRCSRTTTEHLLAVVRFGQAMTLTPAPPPATPTDQPSSSALRTQAAGRSAL